MRLGELLRQKRETLGLTLQEVASAAGTTKGHLHGLENDRHLNPGLFTCVRLATVLGLTVQAMGAAVIESNTTGSQS